jgi:hypothetical protein
MTVSAIYYSNDLPDNVESYLVGLYPAIEANLEPSAKPSFGRMTNGISATCAVVRFTIVAGQSVLGL